MNANLPSTIKYERTFKESLSFGFDGVFDWSWTQGCFGEGKITPMDFDGLVEKNGNFIVFETKGLGVPVPKGQMITFERLYLLGIFTICFIEGKEAPERAKVWCQQGFKGGRKMEEHLPIDTERAAQFVSEWYRFAQSNRPQINNSLDISRYLQKYKRSSTLEFSSVSAKANYNYVDIHD